MIHCRLVKDSPGHRVYLVEEGRAKELLREIFTKGAKDGENKTREKRD